MNINTVFNKNTFSTSIAMIYSNLRQYRTLRSIRPHGRWGDWEHWCQLNVKAL
ncbi:hypothetical protein [Trichormus sp. NMC-1]|uniref:hypothetical protein n=1 Tax=Trichormus sp. NMC-1 TaxID=1853259 RepID=UPI0015A53FBA|nr:hypothetical protein [Trichormus sp. NMC-1]